MKRAVSTIVAVGASAGGLEALERFVAGVPVDAALANVGIQHLDPTHKGLLTEILQRSTSLPVAEITDALRLEPHHVYVIPPNHELLVQDGVLRLQAPTARRGSRLPIDVFFRSLAEDQGARGVGVVLSGMGADGTAGARMIRAKGGTVFVQSPDDAKFPSMPQSVLDAGLATGSGAADELPTKILEQLVIEDRDPEGDRAGLEAIVGVLHRTSGRDFSLYKRNTIQRRVQRRMAIHQVPTILDYVHHLEQNPHEADLLFKELLIGVTSFFRDSLVWDRLKNELLPALLQQEPQRTALRAWIPACSTGEEAYSLGIVFEEVTEARGIEGVTLQIFATDLDENAVEKARTGLFPYSIEDDVSPERLALFFVKEKRAGYRLKKEIRDLVVFATQNVIDDPPFTKLDFLSCRNLLIYLAPALQRRLIPLFHYSLKPGGLLLLGSAETVGVFTDSFIPIAGEQRFYRRREPFAPAVSSIAGSHGRGLVHVAATGSATGSSEPNEASSSSVEQYLLRRFAPATVLADARGNILFVSGRTGRYLELPAGKASWNLFAMAREGLRLSLVAAFRRAVRKTEPISIKNLRVDSETEDQLVDITVEPVDEPRLRGTMIVFFEPQPPVPAVPSRKSAKTRAALIAEPETTVVALADELSESRAELVALREYMQSSDEELKTANEELQSTNEELTTSKEEMQSINEELQTLNGELRVKLDELSRTNNDMKNLLDSTEIAVLFLDGELNVRRFTPQMTTIIKLIPGDIGRPLADLASQLDHEHLHADAHDVLRTLVFVERRVELRDERSLRVRIMPYRTSDNRIDGVVITFTSILSS